MNRVLMTATSKHIGKNGVLGLLDNLDAEGCTNSALISARTLSDRESAYRLLGPDLERSIATQVIEVVGKSDTGAAVFVSTERIVAIQPPVPLTMDVRASGAMIEPLRELLGSSPVIGVVLLRLGRYAVAVLRGDKLLATKTDSRYMKNRHRAGGQSQRRFARSRERLIRELYDKTCEVTRAVFEPYLGEIQHVMLGGERGTLDGFVKRCRLMRDLESKTLARQLSVHRPNQKALEGISYEVWKSRVTFFERG